MSTTKKEKIKKLWTTHKWLLWHKNSSTKPIEPIAWLIRENGKVEYYQKVSTGDFEFDHTNGEVAVITIPADQPTLTFDLGDDKIRGYLLHENYPFPLPEEPLVTAETIRMMVDKITHDIKTARTQEIEARSEGRWKLLIGIAIVLIIIVLGATVIPWDRILGNPATTKAVSTAGKIVKENMTAIATLK